MKALIRNKGETVTEADGIAGINWDNGMPLTCPYWAGGPYQLVDNYIEVADGAVYPEPEDPDGNVQDIIVIDGVTYTRTS